MRIITETNRLVLRELSHEDLPAMRNIFCDAETMAVFGGAWSNEECLARLEKQLQSYRDNGFGRWAVILKATGKVIGLCGLQYFDTDTETVPEIGYFFNHMFWHKGYATEAAVACKHYAFDILGFEEVYSIMLGVNYASMNVAIRNGMLVRRHYMKREDDKDVIRYIFSTKKSDESGRETL
ncbi:MAG: GNAT family N-acetyltransferase [Clostridiales Family XIII bacterium]|jgi:RimJ/RimL family protein N-acetyltransferase|nr:GNAT family N-acetyltransferase [Clostridiales Family XIII bacterium]